MVSTIMILALLLIFPFSTLPLYNDVLDNGQLPRVRRANATDQLTSSVDRLKAVARVATGIYLTQHLIKGTDKQEKITSELLKMGSVTPAQISSLNAAGLETAISAFNELPNTVKIESEMKKIIKNAAAAVVIKENYAGINKISDWPEKDAFKSWLTKINSSEADAIDRKVDSLLRQFTGTYGPAKANAPDATSLARYANDLITNLQSIKPIQFTDDFSRIARIVVSLQSLKTIEDIDVQDSDTQSTLNTFMDVGDKFQQLDTDVQVMNEVIKSRYFPGTLRQLDYTTGFLQGQEELSKLQNDLKGKWMKGVVNSNNFEKSIVVLKQLISPLHNCSTKFGIINEGLVVAFASITAESKKFARISPERAKIESTLASIDECIRVPFKRFADAENVKTEVDKLVALIVPYRESVQQVIRKVESENIVSMLETLKTALDKPESQGKTLKDIFPSGLKEFDELNEKLDALIPLVKENKEMKMKSGAISEKLDSVYASMVNVQPNVPDLECIVALPNLELVKDFHELINSSVTTIDETRPDYQATINSVNAIKSTSELLGKVLSAIGAIKGVTSAESKGLEFLTKAKDVSDHIGNAVRGVGEIQKAIVAIPTMKAVIAIDNLKNLGVEKQKHVAVNRLTQEERSQLDALGNLSFSTLINKLDVFKAAVSSIPFIKLQDSKAIFDEAKKVDGIQDDLPGMLAALDRLMALSSSSQNLKPMRDSLAELRNINLNLASFHSHYGPATASMSSLEAFFKTFSSKFGALDGGGGGGVSSDDQHESGLSNIEQIILYVLVPTVFLICIIIIGIVCFRSRKTSAKLKKALAKAEKKMQKGYQKHLDEGLKEANSGIKHQREVTPAANVSMDLKDIEMAAILKSREGLNLIPPILPSLDNIELFIISLDTFLKEEMIDQKEIIASLITKVPPNRREETIIYFCYCTLFEKYLADSQKHDRAMNSLEFVKKHKPLVRLVSHLVMETRIKVDGYPDGFLHANMIRLPNGLILIAMQGPIGSRGEAMGKKDTCERTWHMFQQQQSTDIVMLCQVDEGGSKKCAQYFPDKKGEKLTFGNVIVTCIHKEIVAESQNEIIVRYLHVVYTNLKLARVYRHIQYTGWPDMKQPKNMSSFLRVLRMIDQCSQPVVVHCSAGIGRTGVFAYVLMASQKLAGEKCNLYGVLLALRKSRAALVYRPVQVGFCVQATVAYTLRGRELDGDTREVFDKLTKYYLKMENGEPKPSLQKLAGKQLEKKKKKKNYFVFLRRILSFLRTK